MADHDHRPGDVNKGDREAAMLDRIEAFRRRKPRLTDEFDQRFDIAENRARTAGGNALVMEELPGSVREFRLGIHGFAWGVRRFGFKC